MKIETRDGREIRTFDDWAALYDTPQQSHQWKEHRSAMSAAEFVLNHNGIEHLRLRVEEVVGEAIDIARVVPEYEQRFDQYGRGRVHDLGVFGTAADGRSLFIGVEAKVDESFGPSVKDAYLQAKANQITGKSTNAPERIEALLALHFSDPSPSMFDVRYQLLYATAGTLAAGADISVLYVVVFKTPSYDETIGASNYGDYVHFVNKARATTSELNDKAVTAHHLLLDGRNLLCLYEYFSLNRSAS